MGTKPLFSAPLPSGFISTQPPAANPHNAEMVRGPPHLPGACPCSCSLLLAESVLFHWARLLLEGTWPLPRLGLPYSTPSGQPLVTHTQPEGRGREARAFHPAYRDGHTADTRLPPQLSLFPSQHPGV